MPRRRGAAERAIVAHIIQHRPVSVLPLARTGTVVSSPAIGTLQRHDKETAGGRRSFQRRLLRRLNFGPSRRRTFTAQDKLRILGEVDCAAGVLGAVGAIVRREGLTRQRCRTGGVSAPEAPSKH